MTLELVRDDGQREAALKEGIERAVRLIQREMRLHGCDILAVDAAADLGEVATGAVEGMFEMKREADKTYARVDEVLAALASPRP